MKWIPSGERGPETQNRYGIDEISFAEATFIVKEIERLKESLRKINIGTQSAEADLAKRVSALEQHSALVPLIEKNRAAANIHQREQLEKLTRENQRLQEQFDVRSKIITDQAKQITSLHWQVWDAEKRGRETALATLRAKAHIKICMRDVTPCKCPGPF